MCTWHVPDALGIWPSVLHCRAQTVQVAPRHQDGPPPPATSQPSSGSLWVCFQHLSSLLPVTSSSKPPGSCGPWGVQWGLVTVSDRPFHCGSIEPTLALWLMELTSPPLASHIFFKLGGTSLWAPRCCPREPNNYGMVGEGPGQPGSRRLAGRGVPGSETSLIARLILIPERLQHGNGHLEVDGMCVLKGRLGLARGREDMLVTREIDLSLSRLLICLRTPLPPGTRKSSSFKRTTSSKHQKGLILRVGKLNLERQSCLGEHGPAVAMQVKSPDLPAPDQDTLHNPQCSACQTSLLLQPLDSSSWQASKLREPAAR